MTKGYLLTSIRLGSNVRDVRYKVEVLTNYDPICGLFKNSFVFDLHLQPFRPNLPNIRMRTSLIEFLALLMKKLRIF